MKPTNPLERFSLKDQTVLLTGATGMIGSQYVSAFVGAGANLILVDMNENALAELKNRTYDFHGLPSDSKRIEYGVCDLRNREETRQTINHLQSKNSVIDILVNNAAITGKVMNALGNISGLDGCSDVVWDSTLEVNLTSIYSVVKLILPGMLARKRGNIINISSIYGNVSPDFGIYDSVTTPCPLPYAATKAAVLNLSRYIATFYGPSGIRCNSITLGGVQSDVTSPAFVERYSSKTALKRMARPEDYVGPMLFLCSEASAYMTGANLIVDGGWTAT